MRDVCFNTNIGRGIGERENEFISHITLARIKEWVWKGIEPEEQPDIEKEFALEIKVCSIDLMESRLRRSGPEYIALQSFPLLNID